MTIKITSSEGGNNMNKRQYITLSEKQGENYISKIFERWYRTGDLDGAAWEIARSIKKQAKDDGFVLPVCVNVTKKVWGLLNVCDDDWYANDNYGI